MVILLPTVSRISSGPDWAKPRVTAAIARADPMNRCFIDCMLLSSVRRTIHANCFDCLGGSPDHDDLVRRRRRKWRRRGRYVHYGPGSRPRRLSHFLANSSPTEQLSDVPARRLLDGMVAA